MTITIQIIIILFVLIGLIVLFNLIRKNQIELKYALSWIFVGVLVIIFACAPVLMDYLSAFIGISSPVNMVFFMGFCFLILIMLSMTVALSKTSIKVKHLIQEMALLEKEVNEYKNKLDQITKEKQEIDE